MLLEQLVAIYNLPWIRCLSVTDFPVQCRFPIAILTRITNFIPLDGEKYNQSQAQDVDSDFKAVTIRLASLSSL